MRKTILIIICMLGVASAFACLNDNVTLSTGKVVRGTKGSGTVVTISYDTVDLLNQSIKLLEAYNRTDSVGYYADYGAALVYLGQYQKAKRVYERIEKEFPNQYTTASNLGTIYELIGKPDSALIWIAKSMELNPDSHFGSEWIHIKILEFQLADSPDIQSSILGLDFGNDAIPANPHKYDLTKLHSHITHQLSERTTFVKPTNEIVGNIYFDYGNIIAQLAHLEAALESYEAAKEYGFESDLMNTRIETFKEMIRNGKSIRHPSKGPEKSIRYPSKGPEKSSSWPYIIGLVLGIGVIAIILWRIKP